MIELTWVADALRIGGTLIALVYYGSAILFIYGIAEGARPKWKKGVGIAAVLLAYGYLPVATLIKEYEQREYRKQAYARFNKYCAEKAGTKIYRRLSGINNVMLMRARPQEHSNDQFLLNDPYGRRDDLTSILDSGADPGWAKRTNNVFEYLESREVNSAGSTVLFETRLIRPPHDAHDQSYRLKKSKSTQPKADTGLIGRTYPHPPIASIGWRRVHCELWTSKAMR